MKFFLDTAEVDEIRQALDWGLCDGVTTNPSLIAQSGRDMKEAVLEICDLVGPDRPVSAEVVAVDYDGMLAEAYERAAWADNVVVKIPLIAEGIKAMNTITADGIKVNATLIFSLPQALLASKAGASYLSPFVGRHDDVGWDGMELVEQTATLLDNYDYFDAEIIVASVRSAMQVVEGCMMGAHIATLPFGILEKLFKHPLTDQGLDKFLADYAQHVDKLKS